MTEQSLEVRAAQWLLSDDTGTSSESICAHMLLGQNRNGCDYPMDSGDLGRCLRLLEKMPEWVPRMPEMAMYGGAWIGLCDAWETLTQTMTDEVGLHWEKGTHAPKTYHLIKLAIADGYRRDPRYTCTFSADGYLSSAMLQKTPDTDVA